MGEVDFSGIGWTVIGTETGNRKGKIPTKKKWADNLCMQAKARGVPVFMKEALEGVVPTDEMIQEFPKEFGDFQNKTDRRAQVR